MFVGLPLQERPPDLAFTAQHGVGRPGHHSRAHERWLFVGRFPSFRGSVLVVYAVKRDQSVKNCLKQQKIGEKDKELSHFNKKNIFNANTTLGRYEAPGTMKYHHFCSLKARDSLAKHYFS